AALQEKWEKLIRIRDEVNKALESARGDKLIGKPLEAQVTLYADAPSAAFLRQCGEELTQLFIVSAVEVREETGEGLPAESIGGTIAVSRAPGEKCERCWCYQPSVG